MFKCCILIHCILQVTTVHYLGFGPSRQDWGFEEVRHGAHMFWWLFYVTDLTVDHYSERPIVIWLQGGPGGSSTGYGNFEEIGPLDLDLQERPHTWVKYCNVLFIDNPVGTGFSYVEDPSLLSSNNEQIAQDLVTLMRQFYNIFPEFKKTPLHIFSESYGGKMAVQFAYLLDQAVRDQSIASDLRSVALGAPWISPEDSIMSWSEFLLNLGFVDTKGYAVIQKAAQNIQNLIHTNETKKATEIWKSMQHIVTKEAIGIDCYNVLTPQKFTSASVTKDDDDEILQFGDDDHQVAHGTERSHKLDQ
ncbi:retinoid-inducible serine carboxypeptidase [Aedes aegypti]|uniref:Carboxypeptidase n=1 Tax=Aedes aegypti TaxID=7159 RepID=A0A6I8TE28_AEDAE|nr:retinoid-inducible serine carboxypeptidase [Aedes aegypti]